MGNCGYNPYKWGYDRYKWRKRNGFSWDYGAPINGVMGPYL